MALDPSCVALRQFTNTFRVSTLPMNNPGAAGAHMVVVQVYVCDFVTLANVTRPHASTMSTLVQSLLLKLLTLN